MLPDRPWLAIACFLVDHGADLDAIDIRGNTPTSHINSDVVIDLLRKRARSTMFITTTWHTCQVDNVYNNHLALYLGGLSF